jgi:ankyrin repeat protein
MVVVLGAASMALVVIGAAWLRQRALHKAVLVDDLATVQRLWRRNWDGAIAGRELYFVRSAAMAEYLIGHGADVRAVTNNYACTPLHFAAGLGAADVVGVLLRHGARVEARDYLGQTPLHWAVDPGVGLDTDFDCTGYERTTERMLATCRSLVIAGADVDARNAIGETALHMATWAGQGSVVELLLDTGADPNASSNSGYTPLHMATRSPEVFRLLLLRGADPSVKNWEGLTPVQKAPVASRSELEAIVGDVE